METFGAEMVPTGKLQKVRLIYSELTEGGKGLIPSLLTRKKGMTFALLSEPEPESPHGQGYCNLPVLPLS